MDVTIWSSIVDANQQHLAISRALIGKLPFDLVAWIIDSLLEGQNLTPFHQNKKVVPKVSVWFIWLIIMIMKKSHTNVGWFSSGDPVLSPIFTWKIDCFHLG
jgi:hypothetical protein